ncbi:hypothetical protein DID73_00355 [Candidatus Marinamargulisbacteria bacterium SCGC AG-343-K17]|nr:hypothetical protein DID73_00355 [Candidatus Marinamargulisbacteria bacterium SCGC AG-343-K17]
MATVIFASAFVWFLFLSPPDSAPLQPYHPTVQKIDYESARGTKKKLVSYIKTNNPSLPDNDAKEIAYWIDEYASKEDIDPMLVAALIGRESSFNKTAVSKTGAKGLGQIKDFNFDSLDIKDPYNVKQNVRGTVKYLKHLFGMWKDSKDSTRMALASYYQGPNETKRKKNNFPDHVSNYVDDIMKKYRSLNAR